VVKIKYRNHDRKTGNAANNSKRNDKNQNLIERKDIGLSDFSFDYVGVGGGGLVSNQGRLEKY